MFTDQTGRLVELKEIPRRIVSVVPSQTELLYHLGLEEEVVGITKFCVHPHQWFRSKTRVGGTKQLHIEKIKQLQPDLVLANKEENVKEQIEELAALFPVWVSDVHDLESALQMIGDVGRITGKEAEAQKISTEIQTEFSACQPGSLTEKYRTAYLIWQHPFMTAGGDTFIHDMLHHAGMINIFADRKRYPIITVEELQQLNCEVLLLSSEPYPFKEKQAKELQQYLPRTKILLVDGEMFSWYGSRLRLAPAYFRKLNQL